MYNLEVVDREEMRRMYDERRCQRKEKRRQEFRTAIKNEIVSVNITIVAGLSLVVFILCNI